MIIIIVIITSRVLLNAKGLEACVFSLSDYYSSSNVSSGVKQSELMFSLSRVTLALKPDQPGVGKAGESRGHQGQGGLYDDAQRCKEEHTIQRRTHTHTHTHIRRKISLHAFEFSDCSNKKIKQFSLKTNTRKVLEQGLGNPGKRINRQPDRKTDRQTDKQTDIWRLNCIANCIQTIFS